MHRCVTPLLLSQVGYITSEIWREGETSFALDHRVADMHDPTGSTLCATPSRPSPCRNHSPSPASRSHAHALVTCTCCRYISSMVVHPSQRGKRLGEAYVMRLLQQVTTLPVHMTCDTSMHVTCVSVLRICNMCPPLTLVCR